ncbi:MAG: 23S rRNA (adenine(2030)-N(6))-methyltransferase RlmJ [Hyphomicrobium sp.]
MNYRHAYHAGNFADVLKHIVLVRILTYLKTKPAPFRVIDTHAGAGLYDLAGVEAGKTGEWREGIGRVLDAVAPADVAALIAPYIDVVKKRNAVGCGIGNYPGSPLIALDLLRDVDRLIANELHIDAAAQLNGVLKGATNAKTLALDAYQAIKSLLPPRERRGLVLIDPPFEAPDEFSRLTDALGAALERFSTGVYLVWYPVKDRAAADHFLNIVAARHGPRRLDLRLAVCAPSALPGLTETGVLVLNPPFPLADELRCLMPWLQDVLARGRGGGWSIDGRVS